MLTSSECLAILKEKEHKKKTEAEEKDKRKQEREAKRKQKMEEKQKKTEERVRKAKEKQKKEEKQLQPKKLVPRQHMHVRYACGAGPVYPLLLDYQTTKSSSRNNRE